jgi:hypothetical protein
MRHLFGVAFYLVGQIALAHAQDKEPCSTELQAALAQTLQEPLRDCQLQYIEPLIQLGTRQFSSAGVCLVSISDAAQVTCGDPDQADDFDLQNNPRDFLERPKQAYLIFEEIAQQAPNAIHVEIENPGLDYVSKPFLVENQYGFFIEIGRAISGTGNFNDSSYLFWREDLQKWVKLSVNLSPELPPDLSITHGVWPDLQKMTAVSGLWRPDDGNCCGSGGTVEMTLTCDGNALLVAGAKFTAP